MFLSREASEIKQLPNKKEVFYYLRSRDKYNLRERKVIEK